MALLFGFEAPDVRDAIRLQDTIGVECGSETDRRRSIRLHGHDYSWPGEYFVTICAHEKQHLFGQVVEAKMQLNALGEAVWKEWRFSARIRAEIELDEFIVMPNHVHAIVRIVGADGVRPGFAGGHTAMAELGAHGRAPLPPGRAPRSLGSFVAGFKAAATSSINRIRRMPGTPVWQRNYYEHIVRHPHELDAFRDYIRTNPARWDTDPENCR